MKITSSCRIDNKVQPKLPFKRRPPNIPPNPLYFPEWFGKTAQWAGANAGLAEQKMFLAAGAFLLQPLVDLKFAQEDKKIDTAVKSASKALAGGITGFAVRAGFLKLFNSQLGFRRNGEVKLTKLNDWMMPSDAAMMYKVNPARAFIRMNKYCAAIASMAAILVMALVTNEKIDVPLTNDFQDFFGGIAKENKTWQKSLKDTARARYEKIKFWADKKFDIARSAKYKTKRIIKIVREKPSAEMLKRAKNETG